MQALVTKEQLRCTAMEKKESTRLLQQFISCRKTKAYKTMLEQRKRLPAYQMQEDIMRQIDYAQVVVVSGETGCGKTTQLPQIVMDALLRRGEGARCNMICTQPRRISAIGVAERVASERTEPVGRTVGYQIRLETRRSNQTRLLFCTTGVLLRRLQCDPSLKGVSHIFVDEIHERDLNTDFLLIILKDLILARPNLKLILMSATLNAQMFSHYFAASGGDGEGCPIIEIPGRTFNVTAYMLEDALEATGHSIDASSDCARRDGGRDKKGKFNNSK